MSGKLVTLADFAPASAALGGSNVHAGFSSAARSAENGDRRHPVPFIVGVGRSGTTLLRFMLDSHPDLTIPPETHFLPSLASRVPTNPREFLSTLAAAHCWSDFDIRADELIDLIEAENPYSTTSALRRFYERYACGQGKSRYGDKTPNYVTEMPIVQSLLPEARFIHLIRDGRDSAISYRDKWFGPGNDPGAHATMWSTRIRKARKDSHSLSHYLEVHYEQLLMDPEAVIRAICDFIELDFSENMLRYHEKSRHRLGELKDHTHPDGFLVTRAQRLELFKLTSSPPDQSRIGVWKTEMTVDAQAAYEEVAGSLLHELGYETRFTGH